MKKPFIARDTKEPLVVLGAYEIASDGSVIKHFIDASKPSGPVPATTEDYQLLALHGRDGLVEMGFHGVIARLFTR